MALFNSTPHLVYSDPGFTGDNFGLAWGKIGSDNVLLVSPGFTIFGDPPVFLTLSDEQFYPKIILLSDWPEPSSQGFEIFDIDNDGKNEVLRNYFIDLPSDKIRVFNYDEATNKLFLFSDIIKDTAIFGVDISAVRHNSQNYLFEATTYLSDDFTTTTAFVYIFLLSDYSAVLQSDLLIADMLNLSGIAVRDIDNDGQLEMALADQTKIKFFKNTSDIFTWSDLNCDIFFPNSDGFPESLTFAKLVASDQWDLVVTTSLGDAPSEIVVYRQSQSQPSDCSLSVNAGSDQTVCKGSTVTLGVGSALSDVNYVWSPSDGITNIHAFPTTAKVCNSQNYTVTATRVNNSDCVSSDSVLITISDCSDASNLSSYSDNVTFFQSCKNCPKVNIAIKHKTNSALTLDEFFSSDGNDANFDDSLFISSYTPVKKNIGINKSYGSDLGFGYVCYTYSNGLTVVRQENGDIILVNNGNINIDSPIDLSNAFHFGDWISTSDAVSSDKKQPDITIVSNKGNININQNITGPGLITCMASNGHVRVACDKTLSSTNNRVVIIASDNDRGAGTISAFISDSLSSSTPSSDTLAIVLTDGISGADINNTGGTITITTNKNVVISSSSTITKNLVINTPASVTTQNITAHGKNINITAGQIHTSDIDTSNPSSNTNADGGNITLISRNEIVCRNLSANGGSTGKDSTDAKGGPGAGGGVNGDGGIILLIAGTKITTASISTNGGSKGGAANGGGSTDAGHAGGAGGASGDGGIITLIAGTEITTTTISANGGSSGGIGAGGSTAGTGGAGGADGDGGTISLIAGTSITTTTISANGGSSGGIGAGGSIAAGAGGAGGADGDGGTISLIAGTSITTTIISANGGSSGGAGGISVAFPTSDTFPFPNGDGGANGTDGDGGTINLIACGDIIITSASASSGTGTNSVAGKILTKSYGTISGIINAPNTQILKMRDLQLSPPNKISSVSGSDITFSLTILNQGFGIEPAGKIDISASSNSNETFAKLPNSDIFFPALLPGQSDQISVNILNMNAGKFEYTLSAADRCLSSKVLIVDVLGQSILLKTGIALSGSYLLFDLLLPSDFIGAFGIPSDHQELCSDIKAYLQGGPKTVGLNIREQSDVIVPRPEPEPAKPKSAKSERGSILITAAGEDGFVFRISDCTSDSLIIEYSDALTPFVKKKMQVIGFEALVVTFEQKETNLGIVSVLPSDQSVKFSDTATFQVIVQNTGSVHVSDAFIKITSNLGEVFSDKHLSFLPSDGALVSDRITISPLVAGSHVFNFEINSTIVINNNTTTNLVSDVLLDVCQLEIASASTNTGPIIAVPNLPFFVSFDLTKTGGNSTAHITAKISDVAYYQSDFAPGSHTIIIDAPGAFVDNTILKLDASDGACYDEDFHVIQVIDSLSDAANLLGTTVSDIKKAIDSNQIMQTVEDLLATTGLIPSGFPSDLIDRLWDTPVFKEILPLLLDRPGGLFDVGSFIQLFLFGSFVNMPLIPNPTLMLYLFLNLQPLPNSDPVSILQTICQGFSAHSDIPHTATVQINNYSDFFLPGALMLNGSPSVNLSCSDFDFFLTATDGSFQLSVLPFNSDPYLLCYSDNTQQICKTFSDKTALFNVILASDNTVLPPPAPAKKSQLGTLFKALLFAVVGGGTILIALKNND